MTTLALDPSATCTGWALFAAGKCTGSGYISRRKGVAWELRLGNELRELCRVHQPGKVVIEDVGRHAQLRPDLLMGQMTPRKRGAIIGAMANKLMWAKAVGVAFGSCAPAVIEGYTSAWLKGTPYAKSKHLRLQFANRFASHLHPVTNVDEATAILFGVWYFNTMRFGQATLFGTATKITPPVGPVSQGVPAVDSKRPGRRLR